MVLILHKADINVKSGSILMLADMLGLQLELRNVNYVDNEHKSPEYTKKNPTNRVITLEDGDFCLAEAHSINLYLLEKYGSIEHQYLYPEDLMLRSNINQRLFLDSGVLNHKLRIFVSQIFLGLSEITPLYIQLFEECFRIIEQYLSQTTYIAHESMTLADITCVSTIAALASLHTIDEKKFPNLKRWFDMMSENYFYQRNIAKAAAVFGATMKKMMRDNKKEDKSKI